MELKEYFCPNRNCKDYRKRGLGNIVLYDVYGKRGRKLLRCRTCNHRFSERKGSIFFGLHTDEKTIRKTIRCLLEGKSIRETAEIIGIDKDTVYRIFERARSHYENILSAFLRDIQMDEGEIEDLWSFLKRRKKRIRKVVVKPEHITINMAEQG